MRSTLALLFCMVAWSDYLGNPGADGKHVIEAIGLYRADANPYAMLSSNVVSVQTPITILVGSILGLEAVGWRMLTVIGGCALAYLTVLLARLPRPHSVVVFVLLVCFPVMDYTVSLGNLTLIVGGLIALSVERFQRGEVEAAAMIAAFACCLKPLMLPWFFYLAAQGWRPMAAGICVAGPLVMLSAGLLPEWLASVSSWRPVWDGVENLATMRWMPSWLFPIASALLGLACSRWRVDHAPVLAVAGGLVLSPVVWEHYTLLLLPALGYGVGLDSEDR